MRQTHASKYAIGQSVVIANGEIPGTIETIKFSRNRRWPVYVIEYWFDGHLRVVDLHGSEIKPA